MRREERPDLPYRGWMQAGLLYLAATTLPGSLWALPFPRSFYEDFPLPGRNWISTLGPHNEHLVVDFGALNLALGILLGAAAIAVERRQALVALTAWLGFAGPHFLFHAMQTRHFALGDNLMQLGSLGSQVILPFALLLVVWRAAPHRVAGNRPLHPVTPAGSAVGDRAEVAHGIAHSNEVEH